MNTLKLNSRNLRMGKKQASIAATLNGPFNLDLGCGPNKKQGFYGVDLIAFPNVDAQCDLSRSDLGKWYFKEGKLPMLMRDFRGPWPSINGTGNFEWYLPDSCVDEIHCSHFMEHLDAPQRTGFLNEMYRVLKPDSKATVICPHWSSCRAYGDPTHKWPPVSEFLFYYLKREWRMPNAPHTDIEFNKQGFNCDFDVTWGYSLDPEVQARNQEYQQNAMRYWKEVCMDVVATMKALKK